MTTRTADSLKAETVKSRQPYL